MTHDAEAETRRQLLAILARQSFRLGAFRLSSGGESDYYIDCRATTLDAEGGLLTGRLFLARLRASSAPIEAVGGLTLGADPIVTSVAVQSALAPPPISGFLVRKAEKAHGTGQRIEGSIHPGLRVAIVDDVCTTAASTIQALEAASEAQLEIVQILCLVERGEAGGRGNLERWWRERRTGDCPFQALFTAGEVRRAHLELRAADPLP